MIYVPDSDTTSRLRRDYEMISHRFMAENTNDKYQM